MKFFWKNIHTKPKCLLALLLFLLTPPPVYAIVDPLSVPNNKFGIHIIQATPSESSPAAELANQNGDWGYITVLIERKDQNLQKWQEFFNDLRRRHLIPIVRIATEVQGDFWKRPEEGEEKTWAKFLHNLNWPVKNRYIIIYNEPNHAKEWGNEVTSRDYAKTLNKTIDALKQASEDFFVLNAGFDASAPEKPPFYKDELAFMHEMNKEIPGIFNKLDGWVSHSYPNPAFAGSPLGSGRGTVQTYLWELQILQNLGVSKNLPVFITETGWKHREGLKEEKGLPNAEQVSKYYQTALETAWNNAQIVAITPFLLSYQEEPFDHFSFKKPTGEKQKTKIPPKENILGVEYPEYYPQYYAMKNMAKEKGQPVQIHKAELAKGSIYPAVVAEESYQAKITVKNTGQSTWGEGDPITLVATKGSEEASIKPVELAKEAKVEPGQEYTFPITLKAINSGSFPVFLNLFHGNAEFENQPFKFQTTAELPAILKITAHLKWKNKSDGQFILEITGNKKIHIETTLTEKGDLENIKSKLLLPGQTYYFTIKKPFYKPKTIQQKLTSGINTLNFGTLQPDIISIMFHPKSLWAILPLAN